MNFLNALWSKMSDKSASYLLRADFDEQGISQVQGDTVFKIAWAEVAWVVAYKKDCLLVDDIRIIFSDGHSTIECSESQNDLSDLNAMVKSHLSLSVPDWCEGLMSSPAFEVATTVLYKRSDVN